MALFKIFKGRKVNLPQTKTDGYAYFTTDDGKFYIDHAGQGENLANRTCINPDMIGATTSTAGKNGFVPAPEINDKDKFLKGDGTWETIPSIPTQATVAEIVAGTVTENRMVSPKVLHDAIVEIITATVGTDTLLKV